MKQLLFIILLCAGAYITKAATVDTIAAHSDVMHKDIACVVIKPSSYDGKKDVPVVYLLHGYSGNQRDWITEVPAIKQYADQDSIIIVCPDGNYNSWYFDAPMDSTVRYETFVSKELVNYMDAHYKTIKDRAGRGITGLSMGGHGAFYLAFKHQDIFGVAGSMSGGVDIRPYPLKWEISKLLGSYKEHPENWEANADINLVHLLTPNSLAIIFDCGTDDFFYKVNVALHEKLLYYGIPHDFIVRPGAHTWDYWSNSISFQLLYMKHYFDTARK
ncbi:esterase family protein [Panacibacter ginsenosidivorans]|uniref:Esterase family protein n=1 Tax=Panacibacter ginsenosidivorans TaxID=1813871 RepID=A0A5B8V5E2_9BACT|nr:alpha/beta hydrolase family protein [Panacibacter ginsenosidivorans]QEC66604.1 esterase family protein [Panacibacter ginsenosidivorans]